MFPGSSLDTDLTDSTKWSVADDVHLLYSVLDNKPVGVDKHFQMSVIWDKFVSSSDKMVTSDVLWNKMRSWYNLNSLDDNEPLPFNNDEEEFKLPAEILSESIAKNVSDEEKRYIDFSNAYKKYLTLSDAEDEELSKLKGNEKLKWFENPQTYKSVVTADRPKLKTEPDDSEDSVYRKYAEDLDTRKVIRQYGKAGEVSSGTIVTVNIPSSEVEESLGNLAENEGLEFKLNIQPLESKNISNDGVVKIKRRRSKISRSENSTSSDSLESMVPQKQTKVLQTATTTTTAAAAAAATESVANTTRSRKASVVAQETQPPQVAATPAIAAESENKGRSSPGPSSVTADETSKNSRRRVSQRHSSVSESKPVETSSGSGKGSETASKVELKRKSLARR